MDKPVEILNVRLKPNKGDRVQIMPIGDSHVGAPTCDLDLFVKTLKDCLDRKIYVLGMGDIMECGLRNSVGDSVYQQTMNPHDQLEALVYFFKPLAEAGLLLGMHIGNHESRIAKETSLDIMELACTMLRVPYLGYATMHNWKVGRETYTAYSCHGSSGARLPYSKIKAALDLFRYVQTEIALMGHLHSLNHMTATYFVSNKKGEVVEMQRHAIITGSFLQYRGSYAEMKNLPPERNGTALISLYGKSHEIYVSL
jgi:hypothetical protein